MSAGLWPILLYFALVLLLVAGGDRGVFFAWPKAPGSLHGYL